MCEAASGLSVEKAASGRLFLTKTLGSLDPFERNM